MASTNTFGATQSAPRTGWGWVLAYGIALIVIGFIALTNPLATGLATGIVLAVALIFYGVAAIVSAVSAFSQRGRWIELILGLLALMSGIAIFFLPYLGALSLVWAIGFWLLISGAFQIVTCIRFSMDRWWRLFLGLLDLVLGAILLFAGPLAGLAYLALMVGISFLFKGTFMVVLAFSLRRLGKSLAS